jgi:3-oxoacyl-[acyl-carrier protein] reductase
MKLKDKVAFLTAAAGAGIGQAAARTLAREGARVVITDAHKERATAVAESIHKEYGTAAIGMECDVTSRDDVERAVKQTLDQFGRIDILFNNAGTNRPSQVADMSDEDWELVINVSLRGVFIVAGRCCLS